MFGTKEIQGTLRVVEICCYLWLNIQSKSINIFNIFLFMISIKKLKYLNIARIS